MRPIQKDSINQSVVIRIIDSTTGLPEQAVEHDTSGIDLWYRREGATRVAITEAALAALDTAHTDGGLEHIDDGYYRLDPPDAAFATGCDGVMFGGAITDMIVIGCYVPLVDYDPYDAVRMGMTALPDADADAAGGLPISDAGGLDLDAQIGTDIDAILTDTGTTLQAELDGIQADTEDIQTQIGAAGAGLSAVPWNAAWDAEVQSECADALTAYDPPTKAEMDTGHGLLATEAKQDIIDTNVDQIETAVITNATGEDIAADIIAIKAETALIVADTNELQTDDVPGLIAALNNITAADVLDATEAITGDTMSLETMIARIYMRLFHEVNVTDADGSAEIRNSGDSGNVATGSITDAAGTTSQAKWSWA